MSHYTMLYEYGKQTRDLGAFLSRGGGYSQKKWVGVCGPLPKTFTLFMSSLQANSRPKSAIFPALIMSY